MKLFNLALVAGFFPKIAAYIPVTMVVLFASIAGSLVVGVLFYLMRAKRVPFASAFVRVIMSYVRGTPVITQLFLVYFSVPILLKSIGIDIMRMPGIVFVIFTYSINFGASVSENIRASINAVGDDQLDACFSIGMTDFTAFKRIIFPQMIVVALPNFANIFVRALKNTSLAFSVGVIEMMSKAQLLGNTFQHYSEAYISISIIYYMMYLVIIYFFSILEKNTGKYRTI
jgi:L-cystine transport system permease protein